jgi:chemotaxis protein CheY-P-specific phosphatase CheC
MFPSAMEKEALSEVIAITGGAYLTAITQLLGIYLIPNYPIVSTFEAIKLMDFIKDQGPSDEEYEKRGIIGVSINYTVEDTDVNGGLLLLIGLNIMDGIEKKINEGPF